MKINSFIVTRNKEVKQEKKTLIVKNLKRKQEDFISKLKNEVADLEMDILTMETIEVDNFNVENWIEEYNTVKLKLDLVKIKLKSAKKIYKELFTAKEDVNAVE